jgi:hypothetical protein
MGEYDPATMLAPEGWTAVTVQTQTIFDVEPVTYELQMCPNCIGPLVGAYPKPPGTVGLGGSGNLDGPAVPVL